MRRLSSIRNPLRRNSQHASPPPQPPPLPHEHQIQGIPPQYQGYSGQQPLPGYHGGAGFGGHLQFPPGGPQTGAGRFSDLSDYDDEDDEDLSNSTDLFRGIGGPPMAMGAGAIAVAAGENDFVAPHSPSYLGPHGRLARDIGNADSPPPAMRGGQWDRDISDGSGDDEEGDDNEEVEMLRQAMQESLQFHENHQRNVGERQRRQQEADEAVLRESAALEDNRRRRRAENDELQRETEQVALEASRREEQERVRRRRDQLRRMDMEFGSGSGSGGRSGPRSNQPSQSRRAASPAQRQPPPEPPRQFTPEPYQGSSRVHPRGPPARSYGSLAPLPGNLIHPATLNQRHMDMNHDPTPGPSSHSPHFPPGEIPIDPANYSLEEVLALSRNESYSTAPFTEEGEEFNHDELQAAINASAQQDRDEEAEAIQRNAGIPTYEEACAAPKLRAPRGARYTFQGASNTVTLEDEEGEGGSGDGERKLEVVGDMDLNEAMRVANAGLAKTSGKGKEKEKAKAKGKGKVKA